MSNTFRVRVAERVRAIRVLATSDPEAAHGAEDKLYAEVLAYLAEGGITNDDAVQLAKIVLETKAAKFPRWTA